jgi:SHAQKYF class myb-like DNA-binding protein
VREISADATADNSSEGALADDAGAGLAAGRWTELESTHCSFLEAIRLFGRKWKPVADHVKTRSPVQIRTHAQKYFVTEARVGVGANHQGGRCRGAQHLDDEPALGAPAAAPTADQTQNARPGKRKPAEIVPLRNERSSSLRRRRRRRR